MILDPEILAALQPWKEIIDAQSKKQIGITKVPLRQESCKREECNIGNFVADAFVQYYTKEQASCNDSIIGLVNSGGIRTTLNAGREFISNLNYYRIEKSINCSLCSDFLW